MDKHETNYWIDLVNRQDVPVAPVPRLDALEHGVVNLRTVAGFVKNPLGEIWVPRRSGNVTIFKHALDFSLSGNVFSAWSYEQQLYYKLESELGLDPRLNAYWPVAKFSPYVHGTSCFCQVYEVLASTVPNHDPYEFESWEWLAPQALLDKLEQGEPHRPDLLIVLRHLLSHGDAS